MSSSTDVVTALDVALRVADMLRDALVRGSCANIFYLPMVTKIDLRPRPESLR